MLIFLDLSQYLPELILIVRRLLMKLVRICARTVATIGCIAQMNDGAKAGPDRTFGGAPYDAIEVIESVGVHGTTAKQSRINDALSVVQNLVSCSFRFLLILAFAMFLQRSHTGFRSSKAIRRASHEPFNAVWHPYQNVMRFGRRNCGLLAVQLLVPEVAVAVM
jgi:hypothetical protein